MDVPGCPWTFLDVLGHSWTLLDTLGLTVVGFVGVNDVITVRFTLAYCAGARELLAIKALFCDRSVAATSWLADAGITTVGVTFEGGTVGFAIIPVVFLRLRPPMSLPLLFPALKLAAPNASKDPPKQVSGCQVCC